MFTYSAGEYYMVIKINMVYQRIEFFIERKCSKNEVLNIIIKKNKKIGLQTKNRAFVN